MTLITPNFESVLFQLKKGNVKSWNTVFLCRNLLSQDRLFGWYYKVVTQ